MLKLIVGTLTMLCVIDAVAGMVWAYEWLVTLWGSIPATGIVPKFVHRPRLRRADRPSRGYYVNIFCIATTCAINQLFYAWRLWIISERNRILVGIVVSTAVTQHGVSMPVPVGRHRYSHVRSVRRYYALGDRFLCALSVVQGHRQSGVRLRSLNDNSMRCTYAKMKTCRHCLDGHRRVRDSFAIASSH